MSSRVRPFGLILQEHGIDPAPERSKRTSWQAFLRAHWDAIAACDFFTVEVLTWTGITRFYVMFVIALQTRRVEIAGIVRQPHCAWMLQVARNLLDAEDGFLVCKRYLLIDRDPGTRPPSVSFCVLPGSRLSAYRRAAPT
jgi:putative transposase